MKILITGGTTFVSRFTAEFFAKRGDEVFVLNRGSREQVAGVKLIRTDRMRSGDILRDVHFDAVLDIAAYTREHIAALIDSGVRFDDYIFISSSAVYPETSPQPFSEETPCGRNAVWGEYGTNKLEAEQILAERVPSAYILRPPYFYGKYDNLYREAFVFDCAMADRPFYLPDEGGMKLQFFHVADLCRFIELLLAEHPENRVFNVGNRETVTVKEWVGICYLAAGRKPTFVNVDKRIPQREYFCFYDYEYALDVSRQCALMPDTLSLERGLSEEFLWYRDHPESVYFRKPYMDYIDSHLL